MSKSVFFLEWLIQMVTETDGGGGTGSRANRAGSMLKMEKFEPDCNVNSLQRFRVSCLKTGLGVMRR